MMYMYKEKQNKKLLWFLLWVCSVGLGSLSTWGNHFLIWSEGHLTGVAGCSYRAASTGGVSSLCSLVTQPMPVASLYS